MTPTDTPDSTTPASTATFQDFGLHPGLLDAVIATGYTIPTPIQARAIPVVIDGRDVMGAAQTGTGKTAAFTLPLLHRLMPLANASASPARHPVRALILTPTRELAVQVYENVARYSSQVPLRAAVVYGGVDIAPQREALRRGCEVLVATPGRLLDHIEQRNVNLSQVQVLVLDEADRMLDMGFLPDLDRIVRLLPARRQGLLFSATFSSEIRKLAQNYLTDPVEIAVAARNATADTVTQIVYPVVSADRRAAVVHVVKSRGLKQVIVFSNTKIGASRLARELVRDGVRAESIHGDKSQLDRMKALDAFKSGELEVLVATDVAARGLDIAGVDCVINYDLPYNAEDYVHRIGRTGRAGASGEAVSFFDPNDTRLLQDIEKLIKRSIEVGTLTLPPRERAPRSRSGEGRSGEGRPYESRSSEGRSSEGRRSGERSSRSSFSPSRQVVDEFFLRPYQPTGSTPVDTPADAVDASMAAKGRAAASRRQVGVLLGGR